MAIGKAICDGTQGALPMRLIAEQALMWRCFQSGLLPNGRRRQFKWETHRFQWETRRFKWETRVVGNGGRARHHAVAALWELGLVLASVAVGWLLGLGMARRVRDRGGRRVGV